MNGTVIRNTTAGLYCFFYYFCVFMVKSIHLKLQIPFIVILQIFIFCTGEASAVRPKPTRLWKNIDSMKKQPTRLYAYYPADSNDNKTAVIICPGGSYHHLGMRQEGHQAARWFAKKGFTAYVLRYRVGSHGYHHPAMMQDIQQAISYIRKEWKENTEKTLHSLGIVGFSAGGHLAVMSGAFYEQNFLQRLNTDHTPSLRPDFIAAVYPVVSMQDSLAHLRSRDNLLGKNCSQTLKDQFSLEMHIPDQMPPTCIVAAMDDAVVNYRNSIALEKALEKKNINRQLLLYSAGGHGFGVGRKKATEAAQWKNQFLVWLKNAGIYQ
jgi:acetyl esterase/lipase